MRLILLLTTLFFALLSADTKAQLVGVGHCGALLTSYTNGAANDSVFCYLPGQTGTLQATPLNGTGPWNFIWQSFNPVTNSWIPLVVENGVNTSTQFNLPNGGYRVSIYDSGNNLVGCYRAWIGTAEPGSIQASHTADCMTVNLTATITGGTLTGYYNPPPDPMLIDASTEISVCFSATHSWVSDLGFFLVGPSSCGSPTIALAPNPGSIGMGTVCNSGNNVSSLCFSTESTANFNVCTAPTPLTGTFGSYGIAQTPIDWSLLNGCDATAPGWSVQIYDCIGLDTGSLTDATITISGTNACGSPQTITSTTPPGFNSPINDNSCSPGSASIFTVPVQAAQPLNYVCGFLWTADPDVFIPNATSLNTSLPAPQVPTAFTLNIVCTSNGNPVEGSIGCLSTTSNPTTYFTPVPWITPMIDGPMVLCEGMSALFNASIPGGVWSGPGIDPLSGNTGMLAAGSYTYSYDPQQMCHLPASITVDVAFFFSDYFTTDLGTICASSEPVELGYYSYLDGQGVYPVGNLYYFDPSAVGPGDYVINYYEMGTCGSYAEDIYITVVPSPEPVVNLVDAQCETGSPIILVASETGGVWSGPGITNPQTGDFDPSAAGVGDWTIVYSIGGLCPASSDLLIQVVANPVIVFDDPGVICSNSGVTALSVTPAGGTWSGTGVSATGSFNPATSNGATATVNYEIAGVCTVSEDLVLNITPEPQPDAGVDQSICEGETATLTVDGTWDTISWTGGGSGQSTDVTAQGNYTVTVTSGGCTGNDQVYVTVISMPNINLGQDLTLCEGDTQIISAPFDGEWSTNETGQSITVSQTGTYSYVYPNSGCPVGDEIYVEVLPYFTLDLGPDRTICPGDSVILESIYDVIWSTGVTATSIEVSTEQLISAQVYNGPCLSTDEVMITELPLPIADLGPDLTICLGEEVILSAFHPFNTEYLWSDGTTEQTIGFQAFDELTYFFEVVASNECGSAEDDISVLVQDCDPVFYIPNAFTPDDDGINDAWRPGVRNVVSYEIFVIDRWGNVVFTSTDPDQYWLGNYGGGTHYVQPDVYFYRISYTTDRYDAGHIEGHVTVVR